jgi:type I restriction enzyme R subunit
MKFNEAQLENAFIELLANEGISHTKGGEINRTADEVLLKDDLTNYLQKQYGSLSASEIASIVRKLEVLPSSDLYDSNKQIMNWVSNGFVFKRENHKKKDLFIELIDYTEKDNNTYRFVNQLEITGYEKRIPDGILYINGLPLVVFEFKTAIKETVTIQDAFVQLTTRYKRDIPELFKYNAFV